MYSTDCIIFDAFYFELSFFCPEVLCYTHAAVIVIGIGLLTPLCMLSMHVSNASQTWNHCFPLGFKCKPFMFPMFFLQ